MPADPFEAYLNGVAKEVPILQGCNKDEMGYFVMGAGLKVYNDFAAGRLQKKLSQLTEDEKALVESYMKDARDVTESYSSTTRLFDQIGFIAPLFRLSENQTMAESYSHPGKQDKA